LPGEEIQRRLVDFARIRNRALFERNASILAGQSPYEPF